MLMRENRRHGLADQLIFPNGSANYYDRVLEHDPNARDFFRYFEAPGVEHCMGGPGPYPGKAFDTLVGKPSNTSSLPNHGLC